MIKTKENENKETDPKEHVGAAQKSPEPGEPSQLEISEPQSAWFRNLSQICGNGEQSKEEMSVNDQAAFGQLMQMKIDDFGNSTGRVAGVTHGSNTAMTATKYNYE